jgi:hypothetical protein
VINVVDPSKYSGLPIPLDDPTFASLNMTAFTTSVVHQLHCLHTVTDAFYSLVSTPPREVSEDVMFHVPHCFDYLRQAIMCNADLALEGSDPKSKGGPLGSDQGWDAKHICKDYSQVKKHLEDNMAFNVSII